MGEQELVVERVGDEPIAVAFLDVSDKEEGVILGYVQPDGTVMDEPYGYATFEAAHDAADLEDDPRGEEIPTGHFYTGLAFAQHCCRPVE